MQWNPALAVDCQLCFSLLHHYMIWKTVTGPNYDTMGSNVSSWPRSTTSSNFTMSASMLGSRT
eukprot:66397-Amphidinium_carterae.2